MMRLVSATLKVRAEHSWLGKNEPIVSYQDDKNVVFAVKRGGEYVAIMNAGDGQWCDGDTRYGISVGETLGPRARQIFNSQAQEFGGWDDSWTSKGAGFDIAVHDGKLNVKLPKWSVSVYQFGS
jgi:hypothetical protein